MTLICEVNFLNLRAKKKKKISTSFNNPYSKYLRCDLMSRKKENNRYLRHNFNWKDQNFKYKKQYLIIYETIAQWFRILGIGLDFSLCI